MADYKKKWSHWTLEERRDLAFYIKKGLDKKAKIQVACAIAAKKLGRTRAACEFQYQIHLKNNLEFYLTPVEEETETIIEVKPKLREDWDFENAEPTETRTPEKAERIVEEPPLVQPVIQVYSNVGEPETAEIISQTKDLIIARARGYFFTIKL